MHPASIGIQTVSTHVDDLLVALRAYREAGFPVVEFALKHVRLALDAGLSPARLRSELDTLGLRCAGGFETNLMTFATPVERQHNRERLLENARILAEIGGGNLVVGTDYMPWPKANTCADPLGTIAESVGEVAAQLEPLGVNLLIEFNWGMVKSLLGAVEVTRRSGAPNTGVLFDPAHYHCTPTKPEHLTPEIVRSIRHVHVNNMPAKPSEATDCNADRILPGEGGYLDLPGLFGQLIACGYDGLFVIEMFSQALWDLPVQESSRRLHAAMMTLCTPSAHPETNP